MILLSLFYLICVTFWWIPQISAEFVYDIYIYIFIYLLQVADICMIVHLLYQTPIFVILFIYSILGKRFLLSTVLEVFSTDTEMLFSVAGFQTSTVKEKKKETEKDYRY